MALRPSAQQLLLLILLFALLLGGCEPQADPSPAASANVVDVFGTPPPAPRWYRAEQVSLGERVYLQHCQLCHRPRGQGDPDWRKQLADGTYPPPPLDGSAHAWHHPLWDLLATINQGQRAADGSIRMPAFEHTLSEAEKQAVIAYIQSLWLPATYDLWHARVSGGKPSFQR
ncbi:MAG: hypothetical protein CVV27_09410 [Candidatus Melainabacteria bacterium HGW-Melainabacteria-1]|nr:MAG: hypothetical protein CVV27_09410 [Candidatus Melainabacteria bacterium HGW-Melainabacteria-1]